MGSITARVLEEDERDFIKRELGPSLVALSDRIGRCYYAAAMLDDGRVVGFVILADRAGLNLTTKIMDEGMGPTYHDCPTWILGQLDSEPPNEYAAGWRRKCMARRPTPTPTTNAGA